MSLLGHSLGMWSWICLLNYLSFKWFFFVLLKFKIYNNIIWKGFSKDLVKWFMKYLVECQAFDNVEKNKQYLCWERSSFI